MDSVTIVNAADYNAATDRVNSALQTLKTDLISLRHQDVTLLKQLIHINETIRTLANDTKSARNRSRSIKLSTSLPHFSTSTPCSKWRTSLVRQQSLPRYCDIVPEERERSGSMSSDDGSLDESFGGSFASFSDLDDSCSSVSSAIPVFESPISQKRSQSMQVPTSTPDLNDDSCYEEILKRNVKLWKVTQFPSDDCGDAVFEEDSEAELECEDAEMCRH